MAAFLESISSIRAEGHNNKARSRCPSNGARMCILKGIARCTTLGGGGHTATWVMSAPLGLGVIPRIGIRPTCLYGRLALPSLLPCANARSSQTATFWSSAVKRGWISLRLALFSAPHSHSLFPAFFTTCYCYVCLGWIQYFALPSCVIWYFSGDNQFSSVHRSESELRVTLLPLRGGYALRETR